MHKVIKYITNPTHNITVNLIGCGGTGSRVLTGLAMINKALIGIGKHPIDVYVFDPDNVTEANIARQMFAPADIGMKKADVLVSRINRFYGTQWNAIYEKFGEPLYQEEGPSIISNITIMCTDTISSRKDIIDLCERVARKKKEKQREYLIPYYIIDAGNSYDKGQVTLSTVGEKDENSLEGSWWLDQLVEDPDEPSCSMAEALKKQHLFVNTMIADHVCLLLWELLTKTTIEYSGMFINLEKFTVNPIKIKP